MSRVVRRSLVIVVLLVLLAPAASTQITVPPPTFGPYTVGDDYFLANYTQLREY